MDFNSGTASVGHDIGAITIDTADGATVTYTTNATYASDLTVGGGASGILNVGVNTLTGSATGAGKMNIDRTWAISGDYINFAAFFAPQSSFLRRQCTSRTINSFS